MKRERENGITFCKSTSFLRNERDLSVLTNFLSEAGQWSYRDDYHFLSSEILKICQNNINLTSTDDIIEHWTWITPEGISRRFSTDSLLKQSIHSLSTASHSLSWKVEQIQFRATNPWEATYQLKERLGLDLKEIDNVSSHERSVRLYEVDDGVDPF